jgi:hypothetical protein
VLVYFTYGGVKVHVRSHTVIVADVLVRRAGLMISKDATLMPALKKIKEHPPGGTPRRLNLVVSTSIQNFKSAVKQGREIYYIYFGRRIAHYVGYLSLLRRSV